MDPDLNPQYNLLDEPWIPVLRLDGTRAWCGFRGAISEAASIAALDFDDPLAQVVAHRHLEAMVLAAEGAPLASEDVRAWAAWVTELLERGHLEPTISYLDERRDLFWLVGGDRPYLQDPAIAVECPKRSSVNKLVMSNDSGNNALFFTRRPDADLEPIEFPNAAAALLAQAAFAAGGRCSSRNGTADSRQGTLRGVTVFGLSGATLLESLLAAMVPTRGDAETHPADAPVWDLGAWATASGGPLSRRTATTKGLLLYANDGGVVDFTLTWGPEHLTGSWPADQSTAIRIDSTGAEKGKDRPFKAAPSTAVWVDAAVFVAADAQQAAASPTGRYSLKPPAALSRSHPMTRSHSRRVRETWKRLTVTATTHFDKSISTDLASVCVDVGLPLGAFDEESARRRRLLEEYAKSAVSTGKVLGDAVREAHGEPAEDGSRPKWAAIGVATDATVPYWSDAGHAFRTLASSSAGEDALASALLTLFRGARSAFDSSISSLDCSDPRRARLVESAHRRLWARTTLRSTNHTSVTDPPLSVSTTPAGSSDA